MKYFHPFKENPKVGYAMLDEPYPVNRSVVQSIKSLFKRKQVFKQARLHGLEFVTVEYLGYANKALNLHRVKHGGLISIIHGGQIR